jgi:4-hydroxybenzoate polyprenyltransferase
MKKLLNITRSSEWWDYKLSPLLALGYSTALFSSTALYKVAEWLLLLILAIIVGAVYVSVINDITDLEDDRMAGKSNRMERIPVRYRWLIPTICIGAGTLFILFLFKSNLSRILYLLPRISFSLYSFPPIRLKKRGIWGVCADACGSHLFISLLMVTSVTEFTHSALNLPWLIAVGAWSFFYGLRGILWHQFKDRENDRHVNLRTLASRVDPRSFFRKSVIIFLLELLALLYMLIQMSNILVVAFLILYLITVMLRYRKWNQAIVLIIAPMDQPYQIIMLDYYQFFLPVSLLIFAAATQAAAWIVLLIHLLLFNATLRKLIRYLLPEALLRAL